MSDVAIVGAGVAGCAAAATALELGYTVVVHEAGPGEPPCAGSGLSMRRRCPNFRRETPVPSVIARARRETWRALFPAAPAQPS